jgi:hypothetical protein
MILDELLSAKKERLYLLCDRIKEYNLKWVCQLRVDNVDGDILKKLKDAGCFFISYGFESANEEILNAMKKRITVKQIKNAIELSRKVGIGVQGNFIFGSPAETWETANRTLKWWEKHSHYMINVGPVIPYPGSEDFNYCLDNGIIKDSLKYVKDGCPSINMSRMTDEAYFEFFNKLYYAQANKRDVSKIVDIKAESFDKIRKSYKYFIKIKCQHCNKISEYHNVLVKELRFFKFGCRNCNQWIWLKATDFPHVKNQLQKSMKLLNFLIENSIDVALVPAIPEALFIEFMNLINFNYEKLRINFFLDNDPKKIGKKYLGKYLVIDLSKKEVARYCKEHFFIIIPSYHNEKIYKKLTEHCNVKKENVLILCN